MLTTHCYRRIAQDLHVSVLKTQYDLKNEIAILNDENSLWENVKDDFNNSIFLTRKRQDDINNEKIMSKDINIVDQ